MAALFTLDLKGVLKQLNALTERANLDELGRLVAFETTQLWKQAVSGKQLPGMTRPVNDPDYAAALDDERVVQLSDGELTIAPGRVYAHADALEEGAAPFDIKEGLLRSTKAKRSRDGRTTYIDIMFRHGVPGSGKRNRRGRFASVMPWNLYRMAKQLNEDDSGRFASPFEPETKPQVGGMTAPYRHRVNVYEDIRRRRAGRGSSYQTFRRVSSNSEQSAWWHPGFPPNPIAQAVNEAMEQRMGKLVEVYVQELLDED